MNEKVAKWRYDELIQQGMNILDKETSKVRSKFQEKKEPIKEKYEEKIQNILEDGIDKEKDVKISVSTNYRGRVSIGATITGDVQNIKESLEEIYSRRSEENQKIDNKRKEENEKIRSNFEAWKTSLLKKEESDIEEFKPDKNY